MKYEIWQIKDTKFESTPYAFRDWESAEPNFNIADYERVYTGTMEQKNILENLWEKFNIDHPADFRGHSLSVSDVVALKKDNNDYWYWYYCDWIGWHEITEIVQPVMY